MENINQKYYEWSLIDPTPVMFYSNIADCYLVVWNGIFMIPEHAFIIASEMFLGTFTTPEMNRVAFEKFKKVYFTGAFGKNEVWERVILEKDVNDKKLNSFYTRYLSQHIKTKLAKSTTTEVLNWFSKLYID